MISFSMGVKRGSPKINLISVNFLLLISSMNYPNFFNQSSSLYDGISFFVTDFHSLPTAFGLVLTFPWVGCNLHCTKSAYNCSRSTSSTIEVSVSSFLLCSPTVLVFFWVMLWFLPQVLLLNRRFMTGLMIG